ncbi:MAG: NAD-dependent epimerase/dehydratase family protein [Candidatus Bathyarchaeia archaeon]|jgi:UDP-glucose 4-epimerase
MSHNYSKILITGGAGFIGSHLVDRLLVDDFEVTLIDNLSTGNLDNISRHDGKKNFHLLRGDIRRLDLVKRAVKEAEAVFHEAAVLSWTGSRKSLVRLNHVNVSGTLALLNASVDSDVKRFIYASSAAVYGEASPQPQREDLSPEPISPYGVSKLSAEQYVRVFHKLYGLETVCLRYFNVYGPRQKYGPYSGVITKFMNRISKNEPPIIYGDGEQTRDFVNIKDVVDANMLALTTKSAVGEVLNIGTGVASRIRELAKTLQEIMGQKRVKPIRAGLRPADIRHSWADINRAKKVLAYDPKVSLRSGLRELAKYFRG